MATRLRELKVFPWAGGVNTSLDEALIGPDELVQGDNIIFSTQSSRKKREGIDFNHDSLGAETLWISSSTITRTVFTKGYRFVAGENLTISGLPAAFNGTFDLTSAEVPFSETFTVDTGTDLLSQSNNGLALVTGTPIVVSSTTTLPAPLEEGRIYFARDVSGVDTKLAYYPGGAAIDITTTGTGTHTIRRIEVPTEISVNVTTASGSPDEFTTVTPLAPGYAIKFISGTVPTGVSLNTWYYISTYVTGIFEISTSPNGTPITFDEDTAAVAMASPITKITYTSSSSTLAETSNTAGEFVINQPIIKLHEYFYDDATISIRRQKRVGINDMGRVFMWDTDGVISEILDAGTPWTVPTEGLTKASIVTFDNRLIFGLNGAGNVMKHYFPTVLGGNGVILDVVNDTGFASPPRPTALSVHYGRLWCNDQDNPDRLHYCETGVYYKWQGNGDSGAIDISPGDGDRTGIIGISPTFKGNLFVGKRSKLYRVAGSDPLSFSIEKITDGLGFIAHNAIAAVDQDDIIFVSDRGVHSMAATDAYGDFTAGYISDKIQTSFNEEWENDLKERIQAVYVPTINSVAFAVAEEGSDRLDTLWFYNTQLKRWYRWPGLSCDSICVGNDSDKIRLYLGTSTGRLAKTFSGTLYDTDATGAETAISMILKTGLIYPDGQIDETKGFKKFSLIYKPLGSYNITAQINIDNFSPQSLAFSGISGDNLLGSTFVLGASSLGLSIKTQAYTQSIDGFGRGVQVTVTQSGQAEYGDILGFIIYFEPSGVNQETRTSDDA